MASQEILINWDMQLVQNQNYITVSKEQVRSTNWITTVFQTRFDCWKEISALYFSDFKMPKHITGQIVSKRVFNFLRKKENFISLSPPYIN